MLLAETKTNLTNSDLKYGRVALLICPTGAFCREDRCQSAFKFNLIPSLRAPLEECEIAGAIKSVGGTARVFDGPAAKMTEKTFLKQVSNFQPDLIVLSVTFGTLDEDLSYATKLKDILPGTAIGLRGAPCYTNAKNILTANTNIDFCVRGDYELVFQQILQNGLDHLPGCIYRQGQEIIDHPDVQKVENLDDLPLPDRGAIDANLYQVRGLQKPQATIHVQRGCPFPCTYCLVHTVSGSKARHRSGRSIAEEIKTVMQSGIKYFYLRAETFTLKKSWVLDVCREIQTECPGARWVTTTRVELVDEEILEAMQSAGCYGISFGIDVASKTIAEKVKKHFEKEQVALAMKWCDKYNIISLAYIMIGFIWDTKETIQETEDFILDIRSDLVTVHFAHPYPGTTYYQSVQKANLPIISTQAQSEPALNTNQIDGAYLIKASNRILRKHYLRIGVLGSLVKKLLRLGISSYFSHTNKQMFMLKLRNSNED